MGSSERSVGEAQDAASLGPVAICKEAVKVLRAHYKLYFWSLQYALLLPFSAIEMVLQAVASYYAVAGGTVGPLPPPVAAASADARTEIPSFSYLVRGFVKAGNPGVVIACSVLLPAGLALARTIWQAPVVYSAGLIVSGKAVSLYDALRAIPRFWKRILVTSLAYLSISVLIVGLVAAVALCVTFTIFNGQTFALALSVAVVVVTLILVSIIFLLVDAVPVLGDGFGFDAVWKGKSLLQGRRWVATGVLVLNGVVLMPISMLLSGAFRSQAEADPWSFTVLLIFLCSIVYSSLVTPIPLICQVVLYKSCKAYHGEDLADSIEPVEERSPAGFHQIGGRFVDVEAHRGTES